MSTRDQVEAVLRSRFEATLPDQVDRRTRINPHSIIPGQYFSAASMETRDLYVSGSFYGCISLVQAVAEAVSRMLEECHSCRCKGDPLARVKRLCKRGFIEPAIVKAFEGIWRDRNDYHHMNPQVKTDLVKLEQRAKECIELWSTIEKRLFAYSVVKGAVVPKYPKYWPITKGGTTAAYVDFEL